MDSLEKKFLQKSREKMSRHILIITYLAIWLVLILWFWIGVSGADAMGYALISLYLVLPVTTLVISVFIGRDQAWAGVRWLMLLFFGVMYMMAPYATFSAANILLNEFSVFHLPNISDMLTGMLCSAVGLAIGTLIRKEKEKRAGKKEKRE